MPELPEVETIAQGLRQAVVGKTIRNFEVRLPKVFVHEGPEGTDRIEGASVESVERRGKLLLVTLSSGMTLLIHLKMTGQLIYRKPSGVKLAGGHPTPDIASGRLPNKTTHAIFTFTDGSELFYNDQRQFGYLKLVPNEDVSEVPLYKSFGPEPLDPKFTFETFRERLRRRPNAKLKPLLLDQTFLAGLGNIYVDESLNLAKLHPLRAVGTLRPSHVKELYMAIRQVLEDALAAGGTSDNTYVTIRGAKGDYLSQARVYHRTDQPCRACGTPIRRLVVAGRGTHVCPRCQRPPRRAA